MAPLQGALWPLMQQLGWPAGRAAGLSPAVGGSPNTVFSLKNVFWYKIKGGGRGAPAQIMAMLSGVQLRWVEVLLPPGDLQPRLLARCSAVTRVSVETAPKS